MAVTTTFLFERKVVTFEQVSRTIEAESTEAAWEAARAMASEFNRCCPDDAGEDEQFSECRDWHVHHRTS